MRKRGEGTLVLTGTNFLRVNGTAPVVTANGTPITSMLTSCTAVPDPNYTIEACTLPSTPGAQKASDHSWRCPWAG